MSKSEIKCNNKSHFKKNNIVAKVARLENNLAMVPLTLKKLRPECHYSYTKAEIVNLINSSSKSFS